VQPGTFELISMVIGLVELVSSVKVPGAVSRTCSMGDLLTGIREPWLTVTVTGVVLSGAHSGIWIDPVIEFMGTVESNWASWKLPVGLVVHHQ